MPLPYRFGSLRIAKETVDGLRLAISRNAGEFLGICP
jgi:hypothetical protein